MSDHIEHVLDFWFGEVNDLGCSSPDHRRRWWTKSNAFDEAIGSQFLSDYEAIVAGDRDAWRNTPRGALAHIIVLDQFSRNMFRGTPNMFAADELAREVCHEGLDADFDAELSFDERLFFYLPLAHSEDEEINDHHRGIEFFQGLVDGSPESLKKGRGELPRLCGASQGHRRAIRSVPALQRDSGPSQHAGRNRVPQRARLVLLARGNSMVRQDEFFARESPSRRASRGVLSWRHVGGTDGELT